MIGDLVISKAGHDKDERYIIIEETAEYVYLADGRLKTVDKPKKKNKKHIQPVYCYNTDEIRTKLLNKQKVLNEEIKRTIKISMKNAKCEEENDV